MCGYQLTLSCAPPVLPPAPLHTPLTRTTFASVPPPLWLQDGKTPLDYARQYNKADVVAVLEQAAASRRR